MSNFPINPNPEFQETMRKFLPDDPAHADMFNQMFQILLDNDAFLYVLAERMIEKNAIANNLTTNDTNMVLSAAMGKTLAEQVKNTITSDTKDNITTFVQPGTRSNITSGEKHSFMLGKISKWFADLKGMAFKDKVDAGDLEASLKSYIDSKFAAENIVQNAEITDEAKVASSAVTHDLQQQITEQYNNLSNFLCNTISGDLNDITVTGIYNTGIPTKNLPPQCDAWCFVIHLTHAYSSTYAVQIAVTMNSKDFLCFRKKEGEWYDWVTVYPMQ